MLISQKKNNKFQCLSKRFPDMHKLRNVDDHPSTSFQLKIKEAIHIYKEQPSLNQQSHHVNLKLSL